MKKLVVMSLGLGATVLGGLYVVTRVAAKAPALPQPGGKPKLRSVPKPAPAARVVRPAEIPSHAVQVKQPGAPAAPLKHFSRAPAAAASASSASAAPSAAQPAASAAAAPVVFPEPMTPAAPADEGPPAPFSPRTSKQAAQDLYDYVTARIRAGAGNQLGTTANRNEIVLKAQQDMKGAKLLAALNAGQGGIYGPLTRTRGKELLGREFPTAAKGH